MVVKKARVGINRFGIRKYAKADSETQEGVKYSVGKIRIKGTRNYKYVCTCPDAFNRQRICKHIRKFKKAEGK